jgi:DNA-binding transcriptional MocR family regulator
MTIGVLIPSLENIFITTIVSNIENILIQSGYSTIVCDYKEDEKLEQEKPVLIHTMPNFHNPTGATTAQAHREHLLAIAEKYRIPIVEDGFEEEMKYFGKVVLPIKSMDRQQLVIYCGTYSKTVFPGIRTGWIIAEKECIGRLTALRRSGELSSGILIQAAMLEFCEKGWYDRHISKMHRVYRKRMQAAVLALKKHVSPQWAEWSEPLGGYLIWLKLKPARQVDWQQVFASYGVKVMHGIEFFYGDCPGSFIRLSISSCEEEKITEGIVRLAKALESVYEAK